MLCFWVSCILNKKNYQKWLNKITSNSIVFQDPQIWVKSSFNISNDGQHKISWNVDEDILIGVVPIKELVDTPRPNFYWLLKGLCCLKN
jgi:hypothetical protein